MKKQFFFKVKQPIDSPEINGKKQPQQYQELLCSFNLDKVLTSIETPTGRTIVMDHQHERAEMMPVYNKKRVKIGEKEVRGLYQTEILLDQEESAEYIKLTSINELS
jgi:hypothetical protein